MNILLINANPVVSRLLALCTRDDAILLNEVTHVNEVQSSDYDVIFVDEASYGRDVAAMLEKFKKVKKVFISYRNDAMRGFDVTIKKPFLPSQIIEIIQGIEVNNKEEQAEPMMTEEDSSMETLLLGYEENEEEKPSIFPLSSEEVLEDNEEEIKNEETVSVLDGNEIEKIKSLLTMDDKEIAEEPLSDEALEERKVELIKEQLIADGLEIVNENEIVEELSLTLDGTLEKHSKTQEKTKKAKKAKKSKPKNKSKNKSNKLKFTEKNREHIEDAVEIAMANMTKKQMKKLLKGKEIEMHIKLEDNG